MTEPTWQVEEEGRWYRVTARASCPKCGDELHHEDLRRVAAGQPETPPLTLTATGDATVELSAIGFLLPLVVHRCAAPM